MAEKQKRGFGKGRSPTKFSFTYEDLADASGCSIAAVRKHAQRGNFDPSDLISVLEFLQQRLRKGETILGEAVGLSSLAKQVRQATDTAK